jgi:drug/metabolite transporter (DMT)-like permease
MSDRLSTTSRGHLPALMLLLATAAWALSFSLGKDAGDRLNVVSGAGPQAFFGPTALQGVRFLLAAAVWFAVIPQARRGWTAEGAFRGLYTGLLLAGGIILQHLALDRTSPAATAFLTSLTILWVPLILCFSRRSLPARSLLISISIACVGLYLLLGPGLTTFRTGEMLGLACSIVFAFHLLAVSHVARLDSPWRMCGAQFLVCGVVCLVPAAAIQGATPADLFRFTLDTEILSRLGVILLFPTFIAFGLMNYYQHQVDPARAALIYMAEPVLAAAADFLITGRSLTSLELLGAGLILLANAIAEFLPARPATEAPEQLAASAP